MKKTIGTGIRSIVIAAAVSAGILIPSCKSGDTVLGPNEIGGETNLPLTQVGNVTGMYVNVDGTSLNIKDTVYITRNDNGIVTYHVEAETAGLPLAGLIPAELKDGNGNVNADFRFKITSDGIQDFYPGGNDMSKPFTIVKHAGNVGDKYEFTHSNGTHIVRTISEKTGNDEWPLGFYLIKTIKTEESPTYIDGVSKIIYRTNHKFGIVYIEFQTASGSTVKLSFMPWAVM